jgi:CRISPR-associated protein (TIGR03984 family)
MPRRIETRSFHIEPVPIERQLLTEGDLAQWLSDQARQHGLATLLAHADDGVIWGKVVHGELLLSGRFFARTLPLLRPDTLQQARLFGPRAEMLVWRDPAWHARLIEDTDGPGTGLSYDEAQWLWGDHALEECPRFTLVGEGHEGMCHAVPLAREEIPFEPAENGSWHPLRLGVRQYLQQGKDGMWVVAQGRLTGIWAVGKEGSHDDVADAR